MHAVKFYRRYWAAIGGLIFVALAFFVGLIRDASAGCLFPYMAGGKLHLPILLLVGAHLRLPRGGLLHHPAAHPQFQEEGYALRLCAVSGR